MEMILLLVAMFAIMYFLMIRPQQKKMREDQEMRSQLSPGDRVLLTSGVFATVAHIGERQMIVELAPGVEVTVLKGNVARKVDVADEEFEFTDDSATQPAEQAQPQSDDALTAESFEAMLATEDEADEASDAKTAESPYEPWQRKDLPSFEAPKDDEPRPEGDK
ncbi:preprotein translocase subunit YajC [Tessaracoccus bendigoensis DSM 12906]|uniref:Preprotein translocase subunit YajC n=1 Tax=Tessaracoccus bendigoensis DSM 12906 TaxID=1123357 RepID=A0A1M6CLE9_9ACTN|nr:preprotein translocase subunit YajC [Tessaracoccus bendigoensis]SHI61584.1 preprotein translocase subunit YajC [Tessaracoccus bendigoensis DSM 12906]